jgi:tryptophan synthase alpha chain
MSQIKRIFKQEKKVIIPYITFGDPSPEFTLNCASALFEAGADIIELGIPFSDPIADGPVIQASHQRALLEAKNVSIEKALECVRQLKSEFPHKAIAFMLATNLVMHRGVERFFEEAGSSQLDGVIIPDLSFEMSDHYQDLAEKNKVDLVQLLSPLCTELRLEKIAKAARGFVYLISSTGITGERQQFSDALEAICHKIKQHADIPVAIGFGVSTEKQVKDMTLYADAVIIGSHLVQIIADHLDNPDKAILQMSERIRLFKLAC